jgi:hypothetical protein
VNTLIKLLLTLISLNFSLYAESVNTTFEMSSDTLTLGLDPSTHLPLAGSDWTTSVTGLFGSCSDFTDVGDPHMFDDGDLITVIDLFLSPNETNCDNASHVSDPTGLISWVNLGLVQDISFGTEVLTCGIGSLCDINMNTDTEDKVFSQVNPTDAVNGTDSGKGDVFSYNVETYSIANTRGVGGQGGDSNLPTYTPQTRYCLELRDLTTHGSASEYAKIPLLSLFKYSWFPVKSGPNGEDGTSPVDKKSDVNVHSSVDHVMRHWLDKDNITPLF